jgi:hypothetical protein
MPKRPITRLVHGLLTAKIVLASLGLCFLSA